MEKYNKKILIIFTAFVFMFLGLVLYMTYFQIVKANSIAKGEFSQYNRRYWVDENKIKRGTIYDDSGNILVETRSDNDGNNYRYFPYEENYAPITGFNSKTYGTTGLEKSFARALLNIEDDTPLSELKKLVVAQERGNDLILTTNSQLQKTAMNLLKENGNGSIVAMNPRTGEIYAMASYPTVNPNTVTANWEEIIADETEARLINRATQGLYAPGSVFKIITATSILENPDKVESLTIVDEGKITIGGYTLRNIYENANGKIDLEKALIYSSNVYFAKLGSELGGSILRETVNDFYIGKKFDFDLTMYKSINGYYEGIDAANIATTAFGQGNTLVTPLNMAMAVSAIANNGEMMQPYLVRQIISPENEILFNKTPTLLSTVTSKEIANEILSDMVSVVKNGSRVAINGVTVAGKSGTAEIKDKESTNDWSIATAPASDPVIAVAVVLEDSGKGGDAAAGPLAREIIRTALNLGLGY